MRALCAAVVFAAAAFAQRPHQLMHLDSPSAPLLTVSVSRNGQVAGALCKDGMLRIWSLASGQITRTIGPGERSLLITAISDDGALVAGADAGGGFTIWKTLSGVQIFHIELPHYGLAMTFSPDNTRLALAPANEPAQIYSIASGKKLLALPQSFGGAQAVVFSPDGSRIATAGSDTVVRMFHCRDGELIGRFTDFLLEPFAAAFTANGKTMLTAGADKAVAALNAADSAALWRSSRLPDPIQTLEISPDGALAAALLFSVETVMKPAPVVVLDMASGRTVQHWLPPGPTLGSAWAQDGRLLIAIRLKNGIGIWSLR